METTTTVASIGHAPIPHNFNPSDHLVELKSKAGSQQYLPVKWRIAWFRAVYPQGTIDTEEMAFDLDREMEAEAFVWNPEKRRSEKIIKSAKGYARFRAVVTTGLGGRATGTKAESAVNFSDFGEKAETGAIGRALAALGFGTQFTDLEFSEGEKPVDAPVSPDEVPGDRRPAPPAPAPQAQGGGQHSRRPAPAPQGQDQDGRLPANEGQLKAVKNLQGQLVALGVQPTGEVPQTYNEAAKLIASLTSDIKLAQKRGQKTA